MRKNSLLSQILKRYTEHEISRAAASLTYYLVFALFPFLVVLCACISRSDILSFLSTGLTGLVPKQVLQLITAYIEHIERQRSSSLILWGAALMLWSFYRAVTAICSAMNKAWGTKQSKNIIKNLLHTGGLTLFLTLSILLFIAALTFNE
ncbi:MAG: YihY/virulence factor BrkB family protein, partial [Oscillospiraceae bacterium]|nr:YihY/virulence factor BrkB family protein [Oscillospiraceae bacterium]